MLFEKKIDVNVQSEKYNNALYKTSKKDYNQIMQMLFDKKINVNVRVK